VKNVAEPSRVRNSPAPPAVAVEAPGNAQNANSGPEYQSGATNSCPRPTRNFPGVNNAHLPAPSAQKQIGDFPQENASLPTAPVLPSKGVFIIRGEMQNNAQPNATTAEQTPKPTPLYIRRDQVPFYLPISLRTCANWQRRRLLPFYRIGGRCIMFKLADLETCLERFRVAPISEPQIRKPHTRRAGRIADTASR
jgi:hypothetical protein